MTALAVLAGAVAGAAIVTLAVAVALLATAHAGRQRHDGQLARLTSQRDQARAERDLLRDWLAVEPGAAKRFAGWLAPRLAEQHQPAHRREDRP